MKIAVIGTFVNDTIYPYQEPLKKSLGGITYTIPYLAKLTNHECEIWPVCVVGRDIYDDVRNLLSAFKNVKTDAIQVVEQENTKVRLVYKSKLVRTEYTTEPMPPVSKTQIDQILDAEVILTNFITGNEILLTDLKDLASRTKGLIYMDYHQLAWRQGDGGERIPWRRDDWQEWIGVANILQMNELEGGILSNKGLMATLDELETFGRSVVQEHGYVFNLTIGDRGSLLFFTNSEQVVFSHLSPSTIWTVHDPTGCGDAFAAAFLASYTRDCDPEKAAKYANRVAGFNCSISGIQQLNQKWREFLKSEKRGLGVE